MFKKIQVPWYNFYTSDPNYPYPYLMYVCPSQLYFFVSISVFPSHLYQQVCILFDDTPVVVVVVLVNSKKLCFSFFLKNKNQKGWLLVRCYLPQEESQKKRDNQINKMVVRSPNPGKKCKLFKKEKRKEEKNCH